MAHEGRLDAAGPEHGGDERALGPLIKTLEDRDPDLRRSAALALGHIRDARVVAPLIHALRDPDLEVRQWALLGLGRFGDSAALPAIIHSLREGGPLEREAAQAALTAIGPAAVPVLAKTLRHHNLSAACAAARVLGKIGDVGAVGLLIQALRASVLPVRKTAAQALGECAAHHPSLDVRAALPLLLRLARQEEGAFYRRVIAQIEAATTSLADLPLPSAPPPVSAAQLPIPSEPGATEKWEEPTPCLLPVKEGVREEIREEIREEGAASSAPTGASPTPPSLTGKGAGGLGSFLRGWRPFR